MFGAGLFLTGIVNLDHLTHVFALLVVTHHIAPSKITERNRQIQKCERFFTLSDHQDWERGKLGGAFKAISLLNFIHSF